MKKYLLIPIFLLSCSTSVYASWFGTWCTNIAQMLMDANVYSSAIYNKEGQILDVQNDIDNLMKQVNTDMTGSAGWGSYQVTDYQSYGNDASNWNGVIAMSSNGNGSGALGSMIGNISSQFPSDTGSFNRGNSNSQQQQYYALKSQTVLATRAASELDYNKIQQQISYQQMLLKEVDQTKDIKSAMDLSNRIEIEGNLIGLEMVRQSALQNQQQAVNEQASINDALSNAKFLTKQ